MKLVSFVILLIETVMISALPSCQTISLQNLFLPSLEVTFLNANVVFLAHCSD